MKKTKRSIIITFVLVSMVLVLVNMLGGRFFVRLDLTGDDRYTLSKATKNILRNLEEPVTVKAYFSKKLPPEYENIREEFKDMLTEYSTLSKGMVVYEFIDPMDDEKVERDIIQKGIFQAQIQGREKDEIKVQKAFMGAEIQMGDQSEVISILQSSQGMEFFLTTKIKKMSVIEKPQVGLVTGYGAAGPQELQQAISQLDILYDVNPVDLDQVDDLSKFAALILVAPKDSISPIGLQKLDEFVSSGRGVFIAINRVDADLNTNQSGFAVNTGIESWLASKGVHVNPNFVLDKNNYPIGIQRETMTPFGRGMVTQQVEFPYFPIIQNFANHPISSGLEQMVFTFVSSMNFTGDSLVKFSPLVYSSDNAGTQSAPSYFNIMKEWSDSDFPLKRLTLGAAIEGPISGATSSKMVVIADGDFPQGQTAQGVPDNVSLMVNSIDWLADDTGLIDLRTKGATSRPLDQIEDGKRAFLKYFNFAFPILLVIIIGIIRFQRQRIIRLKRMEVDYV